MKPDPETPKQKRPQPKEEKDPDLSVEYLSGLSRKEAHKVLREIEMEINQKGKKDE